MTVVYNKFFNNLDIFSLAGGQEKQIGKPIAKTIRDEVTNALKQFSYAFLRYVFLYMFLGVLLIQKNYLSEDVNESPVATMPEPEASRNIDRNNVHVEVLEGNKKLMSGCELTYIYFLLHEMLM